MLINFNQVITDLKGNNISEKDNTLGDLCIIALTNIVQGESLSGQEKYKLAKLADLINNSKTEINLSVEDIALIKKRIGEICTPVAVYRCYALLDNSEN